MDGWVWNLARCQIDLEAALQEPKGDARYTLISQRTKARPFMCARIRLRQIYADKMAMLLTKSAEMSIGQTKSWGRKSPDAE